MIKRTFTAMTKSYKRFRSQITVYCTCTCSCYSPHQLKCDAQVISEVEVVEHMNYVILIIVILQKKNFKNHNTIHVHTCTL